MSPSQKDDDGQEWKKVRRVSDHYVRPWDLWFGNRLVAVRLSEADIDAILADHHDAQQLREEAEQERHYKRQANQQSASLAVEKIALEERVRVLEEALREIESVDIANLPTNPDQAVRLFVDALAKTRHIARALLSPAAATEGGEGA